MNTIVTLCLLAAICTVQSIRATPLDILQQGLEVLRNQVLDIINKLDLLRGNTEQKTVSESTQALSTRKMMLINFSDTLIKSLKNQTEAAKAKGKNAQPCYDKAFNLFEDIKATAIKNGDQCINTTRSSIQKQLDFIGNLISTGQQLIAQLISIYPNCFNINIFQMLQCVTLRLGSTNQLVKNWLTETNQAEWTVASAFTNVSQQSNSCIANTFKPANEQISNATYAANKSKPVL